MVCPQCGTENPNAGQANCARCSKPLHSAAMAGKIACANHGNREATTGCAACAKRLCETCAVPAGGIDFCDDCAPATAERTRHDDDYERIAVVDPATGEHAGFGLRFFGWAIDMALVFGVGIIIALVVWMFSGSLGFLTTAYGGLGLGGWIFYGFLGLGTLLYNAILTAMTGQTLGRQVTGVMVLDDNGHILTLQNSFIRTAMSLVSLLPFGFGFLWALWDKDHQTWHDKIVHTTAYRWEEVV